MEDLEKKIMQEDCSEDSIGSGILTLTNIRVAFDKTKGRIADFTKKIGETVIDIPLSQIIEVGKEGWLIKKVWIKVKTTDGEKTYKFGVYNTSKWLEILQKTISQNKS
ncbi:MAG TPA: hypothetical protein VJJ01_00570 [Nitrosopumilaceae archaeon]|jgi:hypothetical protein|nr:hypothetical protein [Nitrosopumilaceae archaeon]